MAFDLDGYVTAPERLTMLLKQYPNASVICTPPELKQVGDRLFIASTCTIDVNDGSGRTATASAWEPYPGRTPYTRDSEAMNAETSSLARCCGMLGFGISKSIASSEEVRNRRAEESPGEAPRRPAEPRKPRDLDLTPDKGRPATERQIETLQRMAAERGMELDGLDLTTISAAECSEWISRVKEIPRAK